MHVFYHKSLKHLALRQKTMHYAHGFAIISLDMTFMFLGVILVTFGVVVWRKAKQDGDQAGAKAMLLFVFAGFILIALYGGFYRGLTFLY
jgi:hypothetical protein